MYEAQIIDQILPVPAEDIRLPNWWLQPCAPEEPIHPGLGIFVQIIGDRMTGPLYLYADPTEPMVAATKHYVDLMVSSGGTFVDAPHDGRAYARQDGAWLPLLDGGVY